jgi:glycosyltransferase involved in cell wall biosynthesis
MFSIIIPTLNSGQTILKCLYSVINQTFTYFEILIIDGGSIDSTLNLIKSFNDDRIKIFSQKDDGIYYAMNKGIEISNGEWLLFLGSDDELHNNDVLLNISNVLLPDCEMDVIYGNVNIVPGCIYDGAFDEKKIYFKNICHQAIFFKKSLFSKTGLFDIKYKALSDWHHNIKWLLNKKIKSNYVNLIVTNFAPSGYSSQYVDSLFLVDKDLHYLSLIETKGNYLFIMKIWLKSLKNSIKQKNIHQAAKVISLSYKLI